MHRTLYTPTMIETFKTCRRAYDMAFLKPMPMPDRLSVICKHFILRALGEINKGKITTVSQVQKYMGQNWPLDKVTDAQDKEMATKAFLFAYKTLTKYVSNPYSTEGAKVVGAALKVRARVPHVRVYLEDTLDLILWYPKEKKLEFVDFQIQPVRASDPAWPSASSLVKKFLAERLQTRWEFNELSLVTQRVGLQDFAPVQTKIEETIYRIHWPEIVENLEQMKAFEVSEKKEEEIRQHAGHCKHCKILENRIRYAAEEDSQDLIISMSA